MSMTIAQRNEVFYRELSMTVASHFIDNQIPFSIILMRTPLHYNTLPEQSYNEQGIVILNFDGWSLETMTIHDSTILCMVAINDIEYPLSIDTYDILKMADLATGIPVLGKFIPHVLPKVSENKAIEKSKNSMRLVKIGEE